MTSFSSLRVRLVGAVFLAVAPASVLMYYADKYAEAHFHARLPWTDCAVAMVALAAAWYGGERFVLRQVRMLYNAAQGLREGKMSSRTGLAEERGELGELARTFDEMAASLEQRVKEREQAERVLLNRAFQQTVVGALGQFAMLSNDINALLNQVVMLAAQTLELEYCCVLELMPGGRFLLLRAGVGWKDGCVGKAMVPADPQNECGMALSVGEPVMFEDLRTETRFRGSALLGEHSVVSGITVAVAGHGQSFGLLGAYTARRRRFTEDEVRFLFSLATVLAMAVERLRAESELQKLAAFVQLSPNPAMELTADGAAAYCNEAAFQLARSVGRGHPQSLLPPDALETIRRCLAAGMSIQNLETTVEGRTLSWSFNPVPASHVVHCYAADLTDKLRLEAQLRQSQRMESIGRLAAGVAHDFNNMLTVIQGHSGMIISRTNLPPETLDSGNAIYFAAERAASLTRQLLMFSRKNVMEPRQLDLREVVSTLSKMLKRLIGEPVALGFQPPPEIPLVHGDSGMIEQVIMNLAVNARDAMPSGGTLTISTVPVEVNEAHVEAHPEARVGSFVCLRVSDTGCGMDAATMSRIFEPFFTTKEVGKGTGLGLATVYGIVKQHEGWVEVASEPGKGSTFSVYFPASTAPVKAAPPPTAPAAAVVGGQETILIVEDEQVLREMAHMILQSCGYKILEAGSGLEALEVWSRHPGTIDLLLTDVVMPGGMSGRELAVKLLAKNPKTRIVFTSGYSIEETNTDFFRRGHSVFLQKPYTRLSLTKAVREGLDK
jgi:signal transduction histidine kinase/ActR/RegA family two-component response regulator